MIERKQIFRVLAVILFVFGSDYISKLLTIKYIPMIYGSSQTFPYGGIPVFKDILGIDFSINQLHNRGAAWGFFAQYTHLLLWFRIIFVTALSLYLLFFNANRYLILPLALIIGGAIGNIVDFIFYNYVIDMLHFVFWGYDYPVFNIADSAVFIGMGWIIVLSFCGKLGKKDSVA